METASQQTRMETDQAAETTMDTSGEISSVNQTLYLNNLNEKIKKQVLKKALYTLFSQFGKIVDLVCCRGIKLRGQAWICFADVGAATAAMQKLQGFPFYDKPMRIAFAKSKSDIIAKAEGSFVPREKRKRPPQVVEDSQPPPPLIEPAPKAAKQPLTTQLPPSNVLFAQNLPSECNQNMLAILFQQYTGYKEVRLVPGNKGIAFIEFADDVQASLALAGLNGFSLTPTHPLNLSFAKR